MDINLSTGTRPVSSPARMCMHPGSLQPVCKRDRCIMQQVYASKQLGFLLLFTCSYPLQPAITFYYVFHYPN
jgi:hypothetical protein